MPVYNPPFLIFQETVNSIINQSSEDWELCICDDGTTDKKVLNYLNNLAENKKIKYARSSGNVGISDATNCAAMLSSGDYVAFVDHDDLLDNKCIEKIIKYINKYSPDVLYTDEDKVNEDGSHCDTDYKPKFSLDYLRSVMYIMHLIVMKKTIFDRLGGLRKKYDGAQDYDLMLRCSSITKNIQHLPEILYHWRKVEGSAAAKVDAKPWALLSGKNALNEHLEKYKGYVQDGLLLGTFRARYDLDPNLYVTLVILTCGKIKDEVNNTSFIKNFVSSILEKSSYKNYKILIMNNGYINEQEKYFFNKYKNINIVEYSISGEFNYSKAVNMSMNYVETENVIILNDDLEVISEDWIEALIELSQQEDVGVVGAKLLFPNYNIQHCGIALGVEPWMSQHVFYNHSSEEISYNSYSHLIRNYAAITGAVMATRKSLYLKAGGMDEIFSSDYNDVDFCLRLDQMGLRNIFTPFAKLIHYENSSFKRKETDSVGREIFRKRWHEKYKEDDFFNLKIFNYENY